MKGVNELHMSELREMIRDCHIAHLGSVAIFLGSTSICLTCQGWQVEDSLYQTRAPRWQDSSSLRMDNDAERVSSGAPV